jgi:ribosome-binding protein aMBF1 (putative translation factor)
MPKITGWPEEGICSICSKETLVRIIVSGKKSFNVCDKCANDKEGDLSVNQLMSKYGKVNR